MQSKAAVNSGPSQANSLMLGLVAGFLTMIVVPLGHAQDLPDNLNYDKAYGVYARAKANSDRLRSVADAAVASLTSLRSQLAAVDSQENDANARINNNAQSVRQLNADVDQSNSNISQAQQNVNGMRTEVRQKEAALSDLTSHAPYF